MFNDFQNLLFLLLTAGKICVNLQVMIDNRTEKRKTGDRGEAIAAAHLEAKGYRVIARNFRCKAGEIDIIARHGDVLCFAEVKTRRPGRFGRPCEAVDWKKQRRLISTAQLFMKLNPQLRGLSLRMDVIEVELLDGADKVTHLVNAFS